MNDLKQRFLDERKKAPLLGDFIIFSRCIKGAKLTRAKVFTAFNKLVSKEDYAPREKEKVVDWIIASVK